MKLLSLALFTLEAQYKREKTRMDELDTFVKRVLAEIKVCDNEINCLKL